MAAGRGTRGNKKVLTDVIKGRTMGVKLKRNDPLIPIVPITPIDKVRTVAKPNCNKSVQAKQLPVRGKAVKRWFQVENINQKATPYRIGDGTEDVNFLTRGIRAKARRADMRNGDGTKVVDFLRKEDK